MTKMNRRDYLIGMGATAGAMTGLGNLDALAQQREAAKRQDSPTSTVDWPIGNTLPTPTIQLLFVGIMGFRYDRRTNRCEIGVHHGSRTHKLKMTVVENPTRILYQSPAGGYPNDETLVEFGITGRVPNVSFLQVGSRIDRTNPTVNSTDFRWLFDLEHADFYGFRLPLKQRVYRKRIMIQNGVFYTHELSCSKFDIIGGRTQHTNIHVPKIMGARLSLNAGECAFLKVDGRDVLGPRDVCQASGKTYQFWFSNNCIKPNGTSCASHSDFHLNFDAIDLPIDQRFEVLLAVPCPLKRDSSQKRTTQEQLLREAGMLTTDEAPCAGVGFGGGDDFPPLPPG